ncbi:MAG: 5'-deoxyadenosine deaminase [Calditrichia bacterium]
MGILLRNGLIVTQNPDRDVFHGDVLIENDRIIQVKPQIHADGHQIFDMNGKAVIPGFIQSHVHLCQTLFRNLADDLELLDWLENRIWPFEMAHNSESLRTSAQLGLAELLLGGTTSILDMGNGKFQDEIFSQMKQSGIRGYSGKVLMDTGNQPYKETTREAIDSTEKLIKKWHGPADDRIHYALAPRFVPSCSPELWEGVKSLAGNYELIIHTHSSENRKELQLVKEMTGQSNVEFFVKNEMASPKLCLAHCIWVSEDEVKMMSETGINVLHCPSANLKLGSGIAPVPRFLQNGINVSLGADGAACNNSLDMFTEMRLAALIQKPEAGVTSTSAQMIFDLATLGGARALGLDKITGSLEPGKKADLAVLDLNKVHCIPADNIYSQIVYSARNTDVQHTMVDGKWVVFDRELKNFPYEEIVKNTWEQVQKLFERAK